MRLGSVLLLGAAALRGVEAQTCRAFDVASVKVSVSGVGGGPPEIAPGGRRYLATHQLMVELIMSAYDVSPLQISGIPKAFAGERFDIVAECEQPVTKEEAPRLLQALLAERFHLSAHRESREQAVWVLLPGKAGPKLRASAADGGKRSFRQVGTSFTFTHSTMADLTGVLSQVTGRKVLDGTGIEGEYEFTLSYGGVSGKADDSSLPDGAPTSVFTAVRELGLSLEGQRRSVEFVVVDRIERLAPN